MSRAAGFAALLLLGGCTVAQDSAPRLDLGEAEDYAEWLEEQGETPVPLPFSGDPIDVSATGEVRAEPDVAVITATLASEDRVESRALDAVAVQINAVQEALQAYDAQTGFTAIGSEVERSEACEERNRVARQRHARIRSDLAYNRRQLAQGITTDLRAPLPRLTQEVCEAQAFRVFTQLSVRVSPASVAGDVLAALGEAGAEETRLAGYDFADYDALYQEAADAAVTLARRKAEIAARGAGTELGEVTAFSITRPGRLRRFGPQPRIVRPERPSAGNPEPALSAHRRRVAAGPQAARNIAPPPPPPAIMMEDYSKGAGFDSARTRQVTQPAATVERVIPAVTRTNERGGRVVVQEASTEFVAIPPQPQSNALVMSLQSGPQTIRATARMSFSYTTPLDGVVIVSADDT